MIKIKMFTCDVRGLDSDHHHFVVLRSLFVVEEKARDHGDLLCIRHGHGSLSNDPRHREQKPKDFQGQKVPLKAAPIKKLQSI